MASLGETASVLDSRQAYCKMQNGKGRQNVKVKYLHDLSLYLAICSRHFDPPSVAVF